MGGNKLLLNAGGQPMVRRAAQLCKDAGLSPIIAVLGHEARLIEAALEGMAHCVLNKNFRSGMASSLTTGLAALPEDAAAAMIFLGDMPLVHSDDIIALRAAFAPASGRHICIPVHGGRRGNPVLLGREVFAALAGLTGDQGAKSFIKQHENLVREVPAGPGVLFDIDTPEIYQKFSEN